MKRLHIILGAFLVGIGTAVHLKGAGINHANTTCQEQVLYEGANYKVFEYYSPKDFAPAYVGSGSFGVVITGILPRGFEKSVAVPPGAQWREGQVVAIKTAKRDLWAERNEKSIQHEAMLLEILMPLDPSGEHFWREAYDATRNVLVETLQTEVISLEKWLHPDKKALHTKAMRDRIHMQVEAALEIMHRAGWVHSDLKPANILINEKTGQVWLYDYSLASPIGGYPSFMEKFREGNPRYSSSNQRAHKPAQVSDDEYSLNQVLKEVDAAIAKSSR